MPKLHLGVIEVPYGNVEPPAPPPKKPGKRPRVAPGAGQGKTTGDVAEILEAKYHVMEIFAQINGQKMADSLVNSLQGTVESLMMGAPLTQDPFGTATSEIDEMFKKFIDQKVMDSLGYPGVPTKAALAGRSHRFKTKHGPERPSFYDTGLYVDNFKSWLD